MPSVRWCCTCGRRKTPTPRDDSLRSCAERCRDREVTRRPGARALSLAIVIAMVAGCDMPVAPEPGAQPAPAGPQQPAEVTTCNGTPARTRTDWQYPASVDAVFTGSERRALSRLHAEGWNGEGVAIVVRDEFNADGSPSHGEAVLDVARHYAPNAQFIRSPTSTTGPCLTRIGHTPHGRGTPATPFSSRRTTIGKRPSRAPHSPLRESRQRWPS